MRDISEDVIAAVQRGPAEFAMIVDLPLIVFAYRFGDSISWNDVPYCWHLQPAGKRAIPRLDSSPEARVLLWVSLVGTHDGIIHAQRGLTLSPSFTFALHHAIRAQAMTNFTPERLHFSDLAALSQLSHNRRPVALAIVRTMGNE